MNTYLFLTPYYHLLIHNILFLSGGMLSIILPLIVMIVRRKKPDMLLISFTLMSWSVAVFQITQVLGANAASASLSRTIFMFNLTNIWIATFMLHWFIILIGKDKDSGHKTILTCIYALSLLLFSICIYYPN